MLLLIELQIKLTSWAIFSLAGGGLEGERQGEKETNRLTSHPYEDEQCV